jgi:hypothetical protein
VRFVLAIVTFVVAAVLIGVGIAQRTVWAPPPGVSAQMTVKDGAPYTVIDGAVLNAHPGQQTLTIGGSSNPKNDFVAYGRTADVLAWIGNANYDKVGYSATTNTLTTTLVKPKATAKTSAPTPGPTETATPTPTPTSTPSAGAANSGTAESSTGANPVGSDLWLQQFVGTEAAVTKMNVPDSISVIIAAGGKQAAPPQISLLWPLDTSTPWSGPLIVGGGILLIIGLVLYIFALRHLRRSRGPRRSGPTPPKLPRGRATTAVGGSTKGRRSISRTMIAVPTVVIGTLLFTGCSSDYWPSFGNSATPTPTVTALATDIPGQGKDNPPPAVTGPQLDEIVSKISTVANQADSKLDASLIATRFTGPALDERTANYQIRAKDTSAAPLPSIPTGPVVLGLPQATDSWPRVVSAIVQDKKNAKAAPIDLVMVQQTPRDNYMVNYAIVMEADAKVPDLAPASIGTSMVPPDSKLLRLAPDKLAEAYGDILINGSKSKDYSLFDESKDGLASQVGADYKAKQIAALPKTATLSYAEEPGSGEPLALATNDSGAVVATSLNETATSTVVEQGATITPSGATPALTGLTSSSKGFVTTYDYQLLFYVPPADSKAKIQLLGFTTNPIAAKELP